MNTVGDTILTALGQIGVNTAGGVLAHAAITNLLQSARGKRVEWTGRYIGKLRRHAAEVDRRIEQLEGISELLQQNLHDPDFWAVLQLGTEAAGRTGSEEKHELLARAVMLRLTSGSESVAALASSQAVEMIPRLSSRQLDWLGAAALVYAIRPPGSAPRTEDAEGAEGLDPTDPDQATEHARRVAAAHDRLVEGLSGYVAWLRAEFNRYDFPFPANRSNADDERPLVFGPSGTDTAHMVAVSAMTFGREDRRNLIDVLGPWRESGRSVSYAMAAPFTELHLDGEGGIAHLWEDWMQHVTLTPAGLLVGISVHDFKRGEITEFNLEGSAFVDAGMSDVRQVWDGRRMTGSFMDALDREIRSRQERGVGFIGRLRTK